MHPRVLISSRDNHPVPRLPSALKLAERATAHGWKVRTTYALADVPDRHFENGKVAKRAHQLASVAVRLRRGSEIGWAIWHNEDGKGWRFEHAYIGIEALGWLRAPKSEIRTILERITDECQPR